MVRGVHPILLGDQLEKNETDETRSTHGERRGLYRVLVGKPEGKRPLVRPRRRWEDNIKMDLKDLGWEGQDWIDLAQTRKSYRLL